MYQNKSDAVLKLNHLLHRRGLNLQEIPSKEESADINGGKTSICWNFASQCYIGNLVLRHAVNTRRINLRVSFIDNFIPSRDGIKLIPIVNFVTNRKETEIKRQFNNFYPINS